MPRVPTRQTDCQEDGTRSDRTIAVDTHVHLYPGMDLGRALSSGADNLAAAARGAGPVPRDLVLLLTETARDNAFNALAKGSLQPDGWQIDTVPGDPAALRAERRADGARLTLIAGRQLKTVEVIEVLAMATPERFDDGRPLALVLDDLRSRQIPAVLPWGLGKWFGRRGALIAERIAQGPSEGLLIGDNAGRPVGWRTPRVFLDAARQGLPVLPGSDPLPVAGAEASIGRYGCLLDAPLDADRPAEELRDRLFGMRGQPVTIGRRRSWPAVIAEQVALRRGKGMPTGRETTP